MDLLDQVPAHSEVVGNPAEVKSEHEHRRFDMVAVGDIAFTGRLADNPTPAVFQSVSEHLKDADIAIGNLECVFSEEVTASVQGKCPIRSSPAWTEVMREAGINLVSIANNHIMDYGERGLCCTLDALKSGGIVYSGAGRNRDDACAPTFMDIKGTRIAFLARSSVIVSSKCYAEAGKPGVAYLDIDETRSALQDCKRNSDLVVLSVHWGIEQYAYPTPAQRYIAKEMVEAGADIILGHHPHVLQGIERIGNSIIAYSLGNLVFDDFEWTCNVPGHEPKKMVLALSPENREGVILRIGRASRGGLDTDHLMTRVDNDAGVRLDMCPSRALRFKRLNNRLGLPLYKYWWQLYSARMEWRLRFRHKFSRDILVRRIKKLRSVNARELYASIVRSINIITGKSTNPYE